MAGKTTVKKEVILLLSLLIVIPSKTANNSSATNLQKRQVFYYVCGTYPNMYYSYTPCTNQQSPSQNYPNYLCANGGQNLWVGCYYDYQCTPYSSTLTQCVNGCCCTVPSAATTTTTPAAALGYCYNGQRTSVRCTAQGQCSAGQTCMNGLCCTTTGQEYQNACGGITALASCNNGVCGSNFVCTASNYCCECEYGRAQGFCSQGCASGFSCRNNTGYCCPTCSSGQPPYGSCYNGLCPTGYTCQAGNICC